VGAVRPADPRDRRRHVALDDLVSHRARALADRCADARSPHERLRAAAAWIAEQVAHGAVADPAVAWAARAIERSRGRVRIRSLEDEIGMARRRFTTRFREQVGLTPKRLARVTRFRNALGQLHTCNAPLVEVALGCGYYDQPYFNAEFRAIAGCAPAEYRAAYRYPGSSSLAGPAD
jgi:AraC-like DNA-binding protein